MTQRLILHMSLVLVLPLEVEQPALDWSAVYRRARLGSSPNPKNIWKMVSGLLAS